MIEDNLTINLHWKCEICGGKVETILRSPNVNNNIDREEAFNMAHRHVGESDLKHCYHCDFSTVHKFVGIREHE